MLNIKDFVDERYTLIKKESQDSIVSAFKTEKGTCGIDQHPVYSTKRINSCGKICFECQDFKKSKGSW